MVFPISLFRKLYNIFKKEPKQMASNIAKYEFYISKIGENGVHIPEEMPVYANSEKELIDIYAMTGNSIVINRQQLNPEYVNKSRDNKVNQNIPIRTNSLVLQPPPVENINLPYTIPSPPPENIYALPPPGQATNIIASLEVPPGMLNEKIYSIGKDRYKVNQLSGKFYMEKWVKLEDDDDIKIRVMYDTGKPFNMAGKHIEVLKWVEVKHDAD